ncbi:PPC domain-containing DNA-binding protein [Rhodopila sp.]|jgi:predicted DNA-binding protein with PD1-like motif|uniref:PPC domain-containing DNA-binding protein n=1 Tax=Rhodopila sp. TaxID=2480087 RepID=UPI002CCDCB66|nr:PPC domain-containing DNA-binding protein [Rhodopila sp.]HVZ10288.1 PPC domain-containing DNA-binding protein [Rhodopila sp.]
MQARLINQAGQQRTFVIVLENGDDVMTCLKQFVERERVGSAQFTAIGAFRSAVLGYFDWETKTYQRTPVDEQVEVAAFTGDVAAAPDGKPALHIHCVLGGRGGRVVAGHLLEGHVRPTLEIVLTDSPAHLRKRHDPESGLALIVPSAS